MLYSPSFVGTSLFVFDCVVVVSAGGVGDDVVWTLLLKKQNICALGVVFCLASLLLFVCDIRKTSVTSSVE